jgi:hypothetical protein
MSLGHEFHSAANRGNEQLPGLETGLTNVFQLNAANVPATDIPGARLGLYNLQASESVGKFGNADLVSNMMTLNIADLDRTGPAPAPAQGLNT